MIQSVPCNRETSVQQKKALAIHLVYLSYLHRNAKHAIHSLLELSNFLGLPLESLILEGKEQL
jgi:hypothetical protein